ncbi:MAG: CgeB family protein, partial [Planctomycetota bacterium]
LRDRGMDVASIRATWSVGAGDFQLFRDCHGIYQVRRRGADGRWRWLPALGNHREEAAARAMPPDSGSSMPGPYLFEGLDLGWFLRRIYDATHDTFLGYSCALFVVEPDPAAFALVLHLHDWGDLLSDPRAYLLIGDRCTQRLRKALQDNLDLPLPAHAFTVGRYQGDRSPGAVRIVREAAESRKAAIERSREDLEARYARRDGPYWAARFEQALSGREVPLRILAAVSTHTTFLQYSMRDAKRAFGSLGHKCLVLTEKTSHEVVSPLTYHNAIREHDPDLFFAIDHIRPEFGAVLPENLPLLTWDQDQLPQVFTKANIARIGKLDFVAGWSKARCVAAGCNSRQLLHARVPTSPEQFSGEPLTPEERERYTCDVSYVSHASQTPQAFHEQERAGSKDPNLQALLDTMYELTLPLLDRHGAMGGTLARHILAEACRRRGLALPEMELQNRLTGWYLWRLGDRIFRHEALTWVANWARRNGRSFRIYGNGWENHPALSQFAAGPADNGRELLCVYRASAINLQLMPAGFIHQRSLDGLAGGGFFLSRATPYDLQGMTLRRIDNRIGELGLRSTDELFDSRDESLQSLMREYFGEWLEQVGRKEHDTFSEVRIAAELPHPEEVFTGFRRILFDSASQFAEKADHFLGNEPARRAIADEMRGVVVERFSYRAAMDRFLRAMAGYLTGAFGQ